MRGHAGARATEQLRAATDATSTACRHHTFTHPDRGAVLTNAVCVGVARSYVCQRGQPLQTYGGHNVCSPREDEVYSALVSRYFTSPAAAHTTFQFPHISRRRRVSIITTYYLLVVSRVSKLRRVIGVSLSAQKFEFSRLHLMQKEMLPCKSIESLDV